MEPKQLFKQMYEFNKKTFDNAFDTMIILQVQAENIGSMYMEKNPLLPEEGKKAVKDWIDICKKGRDDFKKAVDGSFEKLESLLADGDKAKSE